MMPPFEQKALREALAFAEALKSRSAERIFATQTGFLEAMAVYKAALALEEAFENMNTRAADEASPASVVN